ncbi:MAG TPA: polymer-forming cytoskeletal protein [Steroidobacteraceae bacterium]|nr:polymer-forming cytoskeletal protein [Steroidobacteraceae bacterium]
MADPNDSLNEQASVLGPSLRFKGELHADEDLTIHGEVQGTIVHTQRLMIAPQGRVKADIKGQTVIVQGCVEGDVTAAASIAVVSGAQVTGDVRAPSISIVEGANFNGNVFMEAGKARANRQPEARSAQAQSAAGTNGR